jgi:NAD(P)-dependent dehydrogenase (short-subunit alcohol dehydrogenase family)
VVTGAAGGIGRATALELGRAGYALAVCDLDAVEIERTATTAGAAVARVVDVSRADQVASFADACRERFGRADVLVNNAGILRLGAWKELSEADWRKLFEVNLLSVTLVTKAFLPLLVASRGHIVNLGSGSSLLPFAGYAAYGPVKVGAARDQGLVRLPAARAHADGGGRPGRRHTPARLAVPHAGARRSTRPPLDRQGPFPRLRLGASARAAPALSFLPPHRARSADFRDARPVEGADGGRRAPELTRPGREARRISDYR